MKMEQVSANGYAVLNERNLVYDANSGLISIYIVAKSRGIQVKC